MAVGKKLKSANKTRYYLVLISFKICDSSLKGTELEIPVARAIQKPNMIRIQLGETKYFGAGSIKCCSLFKATSLLPLNFDRIKLRIRTCNKRVRSVNATSNYATDNIFLSQKTILFASTRKKKPSFTLLDD